MKRKVAQSLQVCFKFKLRGFACLTIVSEAEVKKNLLIIIFCMTNKQHDCIAEISGIETDQFMCTRCIKRTKVFPFLFLKKKDIDRFDLSSQKISRAQLWEHIACLTPGCGLFAGGVLGHSCCDGGLLHVHQQEGL